MAQRKGSAAHQPNPNHHQLPSLTPGPGGIYTTSHIFNTSPVPPYDSRRELPLDLVQRIITFVDDAGDLARLTRTSRLFHYMATPRLYENVILKSYPELRYLEGQLEGYGGSSPFSMALNGLVTGIVATFVKTWMLSGEWRERDVEQFSMGRVPDNSMMLSIALRAALDRMSMLEEFSWDMNAKPMPTIYQGLSARPTLHSLKIKCPTSRVIRPVCLVPPILTLKHLSLSDIDPLCYPDDFSHLLLHSRKIERLNLHFNPRMREQCEPSINLHTLFGRCLKARYKLRIKSIGLQNMYVMNRGEFTDTMDTECLEQIHFINNVDRSNPTTVFFDSTWLLDPEAEGQHKLLRHLKVMRGEGIDVGHAQMLARNTGLEEFYIIGKKDSLQRRSKQTSNSSMNGASVTENVSTPSTPTVHSPAEILNVASTYLAGLMQSHGSTLKIVLLSEQWQLGIAATTNFIEACPNLEQLGLGIEDNDMSIPRRFMPYARKLWALRILTTAAMEESTDHVSEEFRDLMVGIDLAGDAFKNIRWFGLGSYAYRVHPGNITVEQDSETVRHLRNLPKLRRKFQRVSWSDAEHVGIFGLDKMEL